MSRENPPTDVDATDDTDRTDATDDADRTDDADGTDDADRTNDADGTDRTDEGTTARSDGIDGETAATERVETVVPAGETAYRCPYCDRPFAAEERVTLHVGLAHYDVCTDAEADAFEEVYLAENEAIKRYRLKAAAVLILVYFGFLMVYAVFGVAG